MYLAICISLLDSLFIDFNAERNGRPQLADLYRDVVPVYAIHWEELGIKLGLKEHHIATISRDNAYNPDRTVDCCQSMLKKWLKIDCSASWDKLRNAIRTISSGELIVYVYVCKYVCVSMY